MGTNHCTFIGTVNVVLLFLFYVYICKYANLQVFFFLNSQVDNDFTCQYYFWFDEIKCFYVIYCKEVFLQCFILENSVAK